MIKVLITGGAGNVGSELACKLVENEKYFIVVVDNLSTGSIEKLPDSANENFNFIKADVNEYQEIASIFLAYKFDYVFHYAAVVGVARTLKNPIGVLKDIEGIKNILSLSKNVGVKRVFYSSSSEVYGEPVDFPQNEATTPLNSRLPYAIVKNLGEAFFKSYQQEYGLDYTIFRFFNTYGPKQNTDFVVSKFIKAALKNEVITIYGDGRQTRTFCYVDDNIDVTTAIFEQNLLINDVINVGSSVEISMLALAELVVRVTGSISEIIHMDALKEGDMSRRQPDNSKMKQILNRNLVPIEEGIKKVLERKFSVKVDQ